MVGAVRLELTTNRFPLAPDILHPCETGSENLYHIWSLPSYLSRGSSPLLDDAPNQVLGLNSKQKRISNFAHCNQQGRLILE